LKRENRALQKRKLAEAEEIDSLVAHLNYDPVTALAEERQARRRDAARKAEAALAMSATNEGKVGIVEISGVNKVEEKAEQSELRGCTNRKRRIERDWSLAQKESSTSYCSGGSVDQKLSGDGVQVSLSEGDSRERPRRRSLSHIDWSKVGMRPASPQLSTINSRQRI
jgi:hypothetical protein